MEITNIQNKKDLITLDLRTKQLRYLENLKEQGEIHFINISNDDRIAYNYLIREDKELFLKCIKEDIENNVPVKINLGDLKILNGI